MTTPPCHLRRYLRAREAARQERRAQRLDRLRRRRHAERMRDGTPGDDCIPLVWVLAAAAIVVLWVAMLGVVL